MDEVTVNSNGKTWHGWTDVSITRALKACAGEMRLSMTRQWHEVQPFNIKNGSPVTIEIGGEVVSTGYVSEFIPSYDAKTVRYELICHDKTVDLVECSVEHESGEWNNVTLDTLAREVAAPFSINVVVDADIGNVFKKVRLEQGETVFELLERLARQRGVLLTSNAQGNLVITTASTERLNVVLKLGQNIRAARGRFSSRERFSKVVVKGDAGSWSASIASETGGKAVIETDSGVARYRPHVVLMEEVFTAEDASRRGKWQISNALARSTTSEITVSGWRCGDNFTGDLWPLNKLLKVIDPIQSIDDEMLISSLTYSENDDGRVTILGLVPPEAMKVEAPKKVGKVKASWRKQS
ncbi:phage baseplate assembly protein [Vibrio spartinae]|uniref:Phage late control gene D protein (GPD) n=1 Tax=Vibrio spartinae TaxID=1918945 RepID=A0A1N6M5U1_9VIBR|nr:contractile injection system protein, VgrG/Pvc8 family [Vibrio spartinae]SIO94785.1 Phage late control gene D protein (GPD) [Vibrio spartinae]